MKKYKIEITKCKEDKRHCEAWSMQNLYLAVAVVLDEPDLIV